MFFFYHQDNHTWNHLLRGTTKHWWGAATETDCVVRTLAAETVKPERWFAAFLGGMSLFSSANKPLKGPTGDTHSSLCHSYSPAEHWVVSLCNFQEVRKGNSNSCSFLRGLAEAPEEERGLGDGLWLDNREALQEVLTVRGACHQQLTHHEVPAMTRFSSEIKKGRWVGVQPVVDAAEFPLCGI